jgi:hypothetical protein
MTKPNAFVVGAAKSGTTSLYHYLLDHPEVYLPREIKEINYISGANEYISSEAEYLRLYEGSEEYKVRMEISNSYLYHPETAERIKDIAGPDAKIIMILRNPVDAAHSLWKQTRHSGREPLAFEEALAAEADRMIDGCKRAALNDWSPNYFYTDRFTYALQVERYMTRFSKGSIAIYIFEEFFGNLEASWRELCEFLEIDPSYKPPGFGKVHNPSGLGVKSQLLNKALNQNARWKRAVTWAVPRKWKTRLRHFLDDLNKTKKNSPNSNGMSWETRRNLQKQFSNDVRNLELIVGRPLKDLWF